MRRYIPYLLLATMTVLAGAFALFSYSQSRMTNSSIGMFVTCTNQVAAQPTALVASCADANSGLSSLVWSHWGDSTAYATGVGRWNDCTPNCAAGHWRSESVTALVWDVKNGRYTKISSSDPRFFDNVTLSAYPPTLG